jgi:hypothetical protein
MTDDTAHPAGARPPVCGRVVSREVVSHERPLGRALVETIFATALGGAIGVQVLGEWWLAGPLAGFGLAVARLWARARRPA